MLLLQPPSHATIGVQVKFNPNDLHRRAEFQKPESAAKPVTYQNVVANAPKPMIKIEENPQMQTPQAVPAHIRNNNAGPSKPANGPTGHSGLATPNQTPVQRPQAQYPARNGAGGTNGIPSKPGNSAYTPASSSNLGSSGPPPQPQQPQQQNQNQNRQQYQQPPKQTAPAYPKPISNGYQQPPAPPQGHKSVMKPASTSNVQPNEDRHVAFAIHQAAPPQPQPQVSRADESFDAFSEDEALFAAVDLNDPDFGPPIHYDDVVGGGEYEECEQSVLEEREQVRMQQDNGHGGGQEHTKLQQHQRFNPQQESSDPSANSSSHSFSGQSSGGVKRMTANGGFNFPPNGVRIYSIAFLSSADVHPVLAEPTTDVWIWHRDAKNTRNGAVSHLLFLSVSLKRSC